MTIESCRRCGGKMKPGDAIEQTYDGIPDFVGSKEVVTISPRPQGELVRCLKCDKCGHSVTPSADVNGLAPREDDK